MGIRGGCGEAGAAEAGKSLDEGTRWLRPGQPIMEFLSWHICLMSIPTPHTPNPCSKLMAEAGLECPGWRRKYVGDPQTWVGAKGRHLGRRLGGRSAE